MSEILDEPDVETDDLEVEPGPSPYADPSIDTDGPQDDGPSS